MPRLNRVHVPGGFYHVAARGNHREALFATPLDRETLNALVCDAVIRFEAKIHAFCWMTNHIHMFLQIGDAPLGKIMQHIEARFARYRHLAMKTSGHLFEKRHGARLVDVDSYFKQVIRYIHMNPVKAGIVADPTDYEWSSHGAYLGFKKISWLTTDYGLSLFSQDLGRARSAFQKYVAGDGSKMDLSVLGNDPRILGSPAFARQLPAYVPPRAGSSMTLEDLAYELCRKYSVNPPLLRSPSRQRDLTELRVRFCRQAIGLGIGSCADVARFLDRDPSAVSHMLARYPANTEDALPAHENTEFI